MTKSWLERNTGIPEEEVSEQVKKVIPEVSEKGKQNIQKGYVAFKRLSQPSDTYKGIIVNEPENVKEARETARIFESTIASEFVAEEVKTLRERPVTFAVETGTFAFGGEILKGLKLVKPISKVVKTTETVGGVTLGAVTVGTTAYEIKKEPTNAPNIIAKSITETTPAVLGFSYGGKLFAPAERQVFGLSFDEQIILQKEIAGIVSKKGQIKGEAVVDIIKGTRKVDVIEKDIQNVDIRDLTNKETETILNYFKGKDVTIYGSAVSQTRPLGDIDTATGLPPKEVGEGLVNALKDVTNKDVRLKAGKGKFTSGTYSVEIGGAKKVEIKPKKRLGEFFLAEKPLKTESGLKKITSREQFGRKGLGTITRFKGGREGLKRKKDVPDFINLAKDFINKGIEDARTPLQKAKFQRLQEGALTTLETGIKTKPKTGLVKPFFETLQFVGKKGSSIARETEKTPSPSIFGKSTTYGTPILFTKPSGTPPKLESPSGTPITPTEPPYTPPKPPTTSEPSIIPTYKPRKRPPSIPPEIPPSTPSGYPSYKRIPTTITKPTKLLQPLPPQPPTKTILTKKTFITPHFEETPRDIFSEPFKEKKKFTYVPNLIGIEFGEPLKREPKGAKIFRGYELRPQTMKPLSISPFQERKINLFSTPKRNLFQLGKKGKKKKKKRGAFFPKLKM